MSVLLWVAFALEDQSAVWVRSVSLHACPALLRRASRAGRLWLG